MFSISQKQSYHTQTHTEFLSLLLYDIFVWFFFGLNWSHNFDCVFGYAKRLSSSQQALFLLLLPFNLTSFSFFFFFFPSTTCFIFITNHFVHYQHHCPMSSWCCRQDPEANPQKGRDSKLKKTHNRNSARNSKIFN